MLAGRASGGSGWHDRGQLSRTHWPHLWWSAFHQPGFEEALCCTCYYYYCCDSFVWWPAAPRESQWQHTDKEPAPSIVANNFIRCDWCCLLGHLDGLVGSTAPLLFLTTRLREKETPSRTAGILSTLLWSRRAPPGGEKECHPGSLLCYGQISLCRTARRIWRVPASSAPHWKPSPLVENHKLRPSAVWTALWCLIFSCWHTMCVCLRCRASVKWSTLWCSR